LRITSSPAFCIKHIAPVLPAFTQPNPNIDIELIAVSCYLDLTENGIDLAIRPGRMRPIPILRRTGWRRLAALWRHHRPTSLTTVGRSRSTNWRGISFYKLLIYTYASKPNEVHFSRNGETRIIRMRSLLEANDGRILRATAWKDWGF
jgi:hypothetical protein